MERPIVIFDLEFTAWEGSMARRWSAPGEHREVVQIGAVRLAPGTLEESAAFDALVRPRINPQLSDYFVELTGITNAAVAARGVDFPEAYLGFLDFAAGAHLACFGSDDRVLGENLALYGLHLLPPAPRAIDLTPWLAARGVDLTGIHSGMVAGQLGLSFEGRLHNALDDARALAMSFRHLTARDAATISSPDSGNAR